MKRVVSACLLGRSCRYDGASKNNAKAKALVRAWEAEGYDVIPLCPEELGDLGTPRPPCELSGGGGADFWSGSADVIGREDGLNRSTGFRLGAERALAMAEGCDRALLKARSPSCGCGQTWIDGELQEGDGVFAARLRALGVPLSTEEDL